MHNMSNVIVWDVETVPDLKGFATANGHLGKSDDEVRAELGDKFPKHIYHSIICIGALVAHREDGGHWSVDALGAPHVGERSEKELIASFVEKIAALSPQLVTFSGSSFDLPVLRYRAMVHGVAAPGLAARQYFHRYTEDAIDLCDVLSSFSSQAKATLHELCRVMGLPGKPDGMTGAEVEKYYRDGHVARSRSTARAMCSTPTGSGYGTSFFAGGCQLLNFRRARITLPSSLRRAATRSRTLVA